ncbi:MULTISPECIES: ABC transporter permease [unclassified Streptomyces]|uniref:ABC transporter permease n=1 Tax=unclassified Streptomyces TaxID=2593676 RepID=UPI000F48735E|nr:MULTISPECIES: ABC transporter permease [unclassified Streptomyces]MCX4774138.1 ABC transporter permease [Streptomyces sp. NBC_01285]ROQ73400.1 putative ABC transport system permease protein [Streptomyces sp. CEV 2-1]
MFLALLELRAARGRFLLMGSVVVLVAALVGIVSGFTTGLGDDTISALRRLPASHLVFSSDARSDQFARSLLDAKTAAAWREDADTDTTPLGISITRGTTDRGTEVDLAAFGIDPAAFLNPSVTSGKGLTTDAADTVVISAKLADEGVRIGDTLVIDRLGIRLRVVGLTERSSYGHVPAAYVPLATWQRIRFSTPGAPASAAAELPDQFSALALRTPAGTPVADLDKRHSTSTVTKEKAYEAAPGYTGERLTMNSIQVFLYLIAPLVVGAFFAVWTVQRQPELALLRALGASRRRLLVHTVLQAALVVVLGTAAGAVLAGAVGLLVGEQVPFSLPALTLTTTMCTVAAVGLLGSALTLRRVTSVDPLTMLGANR